MVSHSERPARGRQRGHRLPVRTGRGGYGPAMDAGWRGAALVADDDRVAGELLGIALHREGYRVIHAADAHSAIDRGTMSPDLRVAVCELELGRHSGVDVLTALRQVHPTLVGVVFSGYDLPFVINSVVDAEWVRPVQKPFTAAQLVDLIDDAAEHDGTHRPEWAIAP